MSDATAFVAFERRSVDGSWFSAKTLDPHCEKLLDELIECNPHAAILLSSQKELTLSVSNPVKQPKPLTLKSRNYLGDLVGGYDSTTYISNPPPLSYSFQLPREEAVKLAHWILDLFEA